MAFGKFLKEELNFIDYVKTSKRVKLAQPAPTYLPQFHENLIFTSRHRFKDAYKESGYVIDNLNNAFFYHIRSFLKKAFSGVSLIPKNSIVEIKPSELTIRTPNGDLKGKFISKFPFDLTLNKESFETIIEELSRDSGFVAIEKNEQLGIVKFYDGGSFRSSEIKYFDSLEIRIFYQQTKKWQLDMIYAYIVMLYLELIPLKQNIRSSRVKFTELYNFIRIFRKDNTLEHGELLEAFDVLSKDFFSNWKNLSKIKKDILTKKFQNVIAALYKDIFKPRIEKQSCIDFDAMAKKYGFETADKFVEWGWYSTNEENIIISKVIGESSENEKEWESIIVEKDEIIWKEKYINHGFLSRHDGMNPFLNDIETYNILYNSNDLSEEFDNIYYKIAKSLYYSFESKGYYKVKSFYGAYDFELKLNNKKNISELSSKVQPHYYLDISKIRLKPIKYFKSIIYVSSDLYSQLKKVKGLRKRKKGIPFQFYIDKNSYNVIAIGCNNQFSDEYFNINNNDNHIIVLEVMLVAFDLLKVSNFESYLKIYEYDGKYYVESVACNMEYIYLNENLEKTKDIEFSWFEQANVKTMKEVTPKVQQTKSKEIKLSKLQSWWYHILQEGKLENTNYQIEGNNELRLPNSERYISYMNYMDENNLTLEMLEKIDFETRFYKEIIDEELIINPMAKLKGGGRDSGKIYAQLSVCRKNFANKTGVKFSNYTDVWKLYK